MTLLECYAGSDSARVRAAALKLADGSIDALRRQLEIATADFRDVVGPAEYPEYLRHDYAAIRKLSPAELQNIYAQDSQQYRSWFEAELESRKDAN